MSGQDLMRQDQGGAGGVAMVPAMPSADQYGHIEALTRAQIQARTTVALMRPRDLLAVRDTLLKDAKRPGFAATAEYAKPVGGSTVKGPSIRFVESGLRAMGNVDVGVSVIRDDEAERIAKVSVVDLESNSAYAMEIHLDKTVERRRPDGYEVLGQRTNKSGQTVYIVRATEDDLAIKQAAQVSKAVRTLGLRLIPGDLVDDAMVACRETRGKTDAQDPAAAAKRVADAFSGIGVRPADLAKYLGHGIDQSSPAELDDLRAIYAAIKDGETTWRDVMATREGGEGKAEASPTQAAASKVREKLGRGKQAAVPAREPGDDAERLDEMMTRAYDLAGSGGRTGD